MREVECNITGLVIQAAEFGMEEGAFPELLPGLDTIGIVIRDVILILVVFKYPPLSG